MSPTPKHRLSRRGIRKYRLTLEYAPLKRTLELIQEPSTVVEANT